MNDTKRTYIECMYCAAFINIHKYNYIKKVYTCSECKGKFSTEDYHKQKRKLIYTEETFKQGDKENANI